jgi:triosephosphate isomerase
MELERTPLIAGNWKMNFDHLQAIAFVQKLSWTLGDVKHNFGSCEVAVFPPFTDLRSVQTLLSADKLALKLGAQDVSQFTPGAYTGDIAASFLAKLDVQYVIIGHSERRTLNGETDELVNAKTLAAVSEGLIPVICVGETEDDQKEFGSAHVPVEQLKAALKTMRSDVEIVVAYEPIWAIGSGEAATPTQAQEVIAVLRRTVAEVLGGDRAAVTRILYGGSVKSDNVAGFLREPDIDGVLVGGASVDVDEFARIVQFQKHVTR